MGLLLAAAFLLHGNLSQAQSFTNGGFESVIGSPIPSGSAETLNPGDTWLPGWSAGGSAGLVMVQNGDNGYFDGSDFFGLGPYQGQQWMILTDDSPGGSLSQTFTTAIGSYCTVSFASAYVYSADDPLLGVKVQAGNGAVLTNNIYELAFREWDTNQLAFIATTTNTTLTFSDASAAAEGAYLGLDGVVLVAEPPGWPYLTLSPTNQTNAAGTLAVFKALAGGNPATVQWYLGTNAVAGATNSTLNVVADQTNAGSYTAVFSNSLGTNVTPPAILTVLQVTTSPVGRTVGAGAQVTFTASSTLTNAAVQWKLDGNPIPGATATSLTVKAANQTAGSYSAVFSVDNGAIAVSSASALLVVTNLVFGNGDFEIVSGSPIPPGSDEAAEVGDTWLADWSVGGTNDEVFVFNGSFLGISPASGAQWVVFDSENAPPAGTLFQTFSTTVGQAYVVTFAAIAIYDDGTPFKSLAAMATASDGSLLGGTNAVPSANWSNYQFTFTATTVDTTLTFNDASVPNLGPSVGLDAVTAAPQSSGSGPVLVLTASAASNGAIVLQISGQAGQSFVLETSTNLAVWTPVITNSLTVQPLNITPPLIPGAGRQFWKAIPAP
jgi:hypothetical protein